MTQCLAPLTVYTDKHGRRYVDVADVAKISGLPARDLDLKYRPSHWAMPRDCRWENGRLWFSVLSLPQLADELERAMQPDAALMLRGWCLPWVEAAVRESARNNFDAGVAQAGRSIPEGTPSAMASAPTGAAARVEVVSENIPTSWAKQWEEKHQ
jgi:hypothetical protein